MKHILFFLLLCIPLFSQAQQGFVFAGGDVTETGGSISFSAGQVFYQTHTYGDGSVTEGVQQPYEISIVTSIEEAEDISLVFSAYPIPVVDFLFLEVKKHGADNLSYQLFDFSGRLLKEGTIEALQTAISMRGLDPAIYFLRINNENKPVKTFKILKNQ